MTQLRTEHGKSMARLQTDHDTQVAKVKELEGNDKLRTDEIAQLETDHNANITRLETEHSGALKDLYKQPTTKNYERQYSEAVQGFRAIAAKLHKVAEARAKI